MDLILIKPSEEFANEIAEYRREFLDSGDSMDGCGSLIQIENPHDFIKKCRDYEQKETLPSGRVIATQFLFVRQSDMRILGMIQVRHYFNDYLSRFGGHIGYSVRPTERKKGYAKQMLSGVLPYCRKIGLDKILITCNEDNTASEKTIISCGGVYESTLYEPNEDVNLKRFWIDIK